MAHGNTLLAKLVSCQFNDRRVKKGYFLTARHVQFLSNTLHAHCAHRYFAHRAVCFGTCLSCSYHVIRLDANASRKLGKSSNIQTVNG